VKLIKTHLCLFEGWGKKSLIPHFKGGTVFGPGLSPVVQARGRHVGVPEPLLDLGNVGFMREGVGGAAVARRE